MTLTYIRPDADDTDGTWTNESDSGSNLFASIDETVADDNDYIKSVHLPDHDICKIRLSDPSGMVMRPATVHYRFKKRGETTQQINLDVSLLQGSTEIASWSESDIGTAYVDGSQALTVDQFNAISDFTNLYLQFDAFSAWWLTNSSVDLSFETDLYYDSSYATATDSAHLLLHCDGADASTKFIDATGRHQMANLGVSQQIDTAQSKFGGGSILFVNSTGDGIATTNDNTDFSFATGDFTIDFWFRLTSVTGHITTLFQNTVSGDLQIYIPSGGGTLHVSSGGDQITGATTITLNAWHHCALTCSSGAKRLFLNGTQEGSTWSSATNLTLGGVRFSGGGDALDGWLDEIRVIKGTAAWTTTFTPPTAPYNVALSGPYAHLSISRASIGYATTSTGTLTQFAANALRITDLGLLVEDARTNVQAYSQDITQTAAIWSQANISVGSNTTAPDGTSTAQQVIENSSLGYHRVFSQTLPTVTASAVTASVYLKDGSSNGRRYVGLQLTDPTADTRQSVVCDLQLGTITQTGTRGTPSGSPTWHISAHANGWYRVDISGYTFAGTTSEIEVFGSNSATPPLDAFALIQYTGDGVSNFYVWGFQIENGAFPSSYIPTTTVAVTRAADSIQFIGNADTILAALPNSTVVDLILETTGSFVANAHIIGKAGSNAPLLMNSNTVVWGSVNSTFLTQATLGGSRTFAGGVKVAQAQASTPTSSLVGGGGTVSVDAVAQGTTGLSLMNSITGQSIFAYCRRVTLWNSKLADATLQGFTNP